MVFSDLFFLFVFIPAFIVTYLLAALVDKAVAGKVPTARNLAIVLFSLIFYAWGEPSYVFLLIFSVAVNFLWGKAISGGGSRRKLALGLGLTFNILLLVVFKYLGMITGSLAGLGLHVSRINIALPIGISFYTFQSISYLVDVYRGDSPAQKRFYNFLLYISMFPQLIAGPIVRYGTIAAAINERHVSLKDICEGAFRFFIGLCKKVILANQLFEISGRLLGGQLEQLTSAGALVGLLAFTMQIYFDFSGYSDMAIGIGRCLGFRFNENFNHPYCCDSITDFWRRWHMSLGSFFRDYVYIPLGGNRRHQAINILVVWFLTGIWHGASWNFVIWGLYFGVIVMVEKYTILKVKDRIPSLLLHVYSLTLVVLGWGIFYFDDFSRMSGFFSALFSGDWFSGDLVTQSILNDTFWLWAVAVVLCLPVRSFFEELLQKISFRREGLGQTILFIYQSAVSVAILCLSTALLVGATNNAFIYTRF